MVRTRLVVLVLTFAAVGCQCNCANTIVIPHDGGVGDAGAGTGSDAGESGGGSSSGGGTGAGGGAFDAGDSTTTTTIGVGGFVFDGGSAGTGTGVQLDPNGYVILSQGSLESYFMWIANNDHGWVSKYDTRTGKEVGRYFAVIPKDCANSAGPPCAGGTVHTQYAPGNNPSRTAIDLNGDVWVANRAVGSQGSVTKIANVERDCIDRNGNGHIETSRDLNNDGEISVAPADGEMVIPTDNTNILQYDECVLFTKLLGPPTGSVGARAIAVAAGFEGGAGDIWVGIFSEAKAYKLNNANGEIVPINGQQSITLPWGPYGAVVDRAQHVYFIKPGVSELAVIDSMTGTVTNPHLVPPNGANCSSYGFAVDGKNRIWMPNWSGQTTDVCRYDPADGGVWTTFNFQTTTTQTGSQLHRGRGIAVDNMGQVYMSGYDGTAADLIRFNSDTGAIIPFATANGPANAINAGDSRTNGCIGVGIDADNNPWVNNYSGNAMKIDRVTGAITRTAQQPAGLYTYSDFTGYALRTFTAPRGSYFRDLVGCDGPNVWKSLTFDIGVPANTSIQVYVKVADTQAELGLMTTMRYGPFTASPVDLVAAGVPKKRYMRLEFSLTSNGVGTPVLRGFNVVSTCEITIN